MQAPRARGWRFAYCAPAQFEEMGDLHGLPVVRTLPDGTRDYVFGQDGGKRAAEKYGTELLAEVPLRTALRRCGDEGRPAVLGEDETAQTFLSIAERIVAKLPVDAA